MPYGKSGGPTMAYVYRAYRPISGLDAVREAMRGRVRLWNRLVEIDRAYRADARALVGERRTRDALAEQPELAPRLLLLEESRRQQVRDACNESGLHWMDADDVRIAYDQARRRHGSLYRVWRDHEGQTHYEPRDLRFHGYFGEGKVTIRVPKTKTAFEYTPLPSSRRGSQEANLRLLVGKEREEVVLRVRQHRPIPEDGVIQKADLICRRVGYREEWRLVLSVRTASAVGAPSEQPGSVRVSLHWRVHDDGLLVAAWEGSDGRTGELVLPARYLSGWERVQDLRSLRDQLANAALAVLREEMRAGHALPAWLADALGRVGERPSAYQLCALMDRWYREGGDGSKIYEELQRWVRREHHIADEENGLRQRLLRWREWLYGNLAAQLCRVYGEIRVDGMDLRRLARRKRAEDPGERARLEQVNYQRVIAAPSALRLRLASTARRTGVRFVTEGRKGQAERSEQSMFS